MTKSKVVHMDWFSENIGEEILLKIHCSCFLPSGKLPGGKGSYKQGKKVSGLTKPYTTHSQLSQTELLFQTPLA